jgi:hypothetical protein
VVGPFPTTMAWCFLLAPSLRQNKAEKSRDFWAVVWVELTETSCPEGRASLLLPPHRSSTSHHMVIEKESDCIWWNLIDACKIYWNLVNIINVGCSWGLGKFWQKVTVREKL